MRAIRIGALALTASAVVACSLAAGASAGLPELGRCVKVPGGKYAGSNCLRLAARKGSYEWEAGPGEKKKFAGASTTLVTLETVGAKRKISCSSAQFEGEYTGAKTETLKVALVGCGEVANSKGCQSSPLAEGEITGELEGELGYIVGGEKPQAGWDLKPKSPATSLFTFTCGKLPEVALLATIEGSVIGRALPIDKMAVESKITYKALRGVQSPQSFEGGAKDTLTGKFLAGVESTTEELGLSGVRVDENEEPLELKAK